MEIGDIFSVYRSRGGVGAERYPRGYVPRARSDRPRYSFGSTVYVR